MQFKYIVFGQTIRNACQQFRYVIFDLKSYSIVNVKLQCTRKCTINRPAVQQIQHLCHIVSNTIEKKGIGKDLQNPVITLTYFTDTLQLNVDIISRDIVSFTAPVGEIGCLCQLKTGQMHRDNIELLNA